MLFLIFSAVILVAAAEDAFPIEFIDYTDWDMNLEQETRQRRNLPEERRRSGLGIAYPGQRRPVHGPRPYGPYAEPDQNDWVRHPEEPSSRERRQSSSIRSPAAGEMRYGKKDDYFNEPNTRPDYGGGDIYNRRW